MFESTYKWWHLSFSVWLTSLSVIISGSIHAAANGIMEMLPWVSAQMPSSLWLLADHPSWNQPLPPQCSSWIAFHSLAWPPAGRCSISWMACGCPAPNSLLPVISSWGYPSWWGTGVLVISYDSGSHYGRSHKKISDTQGRSGYKGPSRLTPASIPPCILPSFQLLFLFALLQILVLPAPLSLNKDQLKTIINKSPGCWYPVKRPGMKEMLQFKPFCWHSGLFDKCVLSLQKMLMIVLNILSTVR